MTPAHSQDEMLLLHSSIDAALAAHHPADWTPPDDGSIDLPAWQLCTSLGWDHAGLPDELGGLGGGVGPLVLLARACGRHRVSAPLVETGLARWALGVADADQPPEGTIVTLPLGGDGAALDLASNPAGLSASGHLRAVPWGRDADFLVAGSQARTLLLADLRSERVVRTNGANLAGEARDDLWLDELPVAEFPGEGGRTAASLLGPRATLLRVAQISAAAQRALEITREHTSVRKQFGQPLNRFQLIGAHLAKMVAQTDLVTAMLEEAVRAHDAGEPEPSTPALAFIAARAATSVTRSAHQCHGAIGISREYRLHQFTRRLLAWREEAGSEPGWSEALGELVLSGAPGELWRATTPTGESADG
jgi:acyl-CoA dehydrogenase